MMDPVTMWILFLLVNGRGHVAEGYRSLEDCQKEREVAVQVPTTLMVSECTEVTLVPLKGEAKK